MSITNLKKIILSPDEPLETNAISWGSVEEKINCVLPNDFKLFIDSYGTGVIGGFLWVFNPKSINDNLNFAKSEYFRASYIQMKELFPEDYKRPSFPQKTSFLTWAISDNGDSLFWIINSNNPDDWIVGIHNSDQGEEEIFEMNTCDFLISLANQELHSDIFPEDFLEGTMSFVSYPN